MGRLLMIQLQRYRNNPILSPLAGSWWESLAVTNPAVWQDPASGEVTMLYRAAGSDPEHRIYLGLARSRDGFHFERVSDEPVLGPSKDGFDAGCVEDPRMVKIEDWFYVTYACRPFPPGQYWLPRDERGYGPPQLPEHFPWIYRKNATATGLALTRDFKTWFRAGRLTNPTADDRDVYLFPEKIGGFYYMIHRPMNWTGPTYGTDFPAIWISRSNDLLQWTESKILAQARGEDWESAKIGGNTPPIRTRAGWLTLYHAVGPDGRYRLGALLLDLEDPFLVLRRTADWLMQPEETYELDGFYPGVCFPCGKFVRDGVLFVYYGGADRYVCLATVELDALLDQMLEGPMP